MTFNIILGQKIPFFIDTMAPLIDIMDNGISWLMGSNLSHLTNPNLLFHLYLYVKFIRLLLSIVYLRNQFHSLPKWSH